MADILASELARMAPLQQLMKRMRAQAEFAQAQQAKALEEEQRAAAAAASAPQPGKITVRSADEFEF